MRFVVCTERHTLELNAMGNRVHHCWTISVLIKGGIASRLMFRKHMSDLCDYLSKEFGIVISGDIIAHILWGDDLILFSDTVEGLQRQLIGLQKFCSHNKIIVNETKTKCMCFGTVDNFDVHFNGKLIEQVPRYKYLGTIVRCTKRINQNIFQKVHHLYVTNLEKLYLNYRKKLNFR